MCVCLIYKWTEGARVNQEPTRGQMAKYSSNHFKPTFYLGEPMDGGGQR